MVKRFKKSFIAPIPITISTQIYGLLPNIYPHNPISWIHFFVKYLWIYFKPIPQRSISNLSVVFEDNLFKVLNKQHQERLWDYGFFGKGTLSRSELNWYSSTQKRLHLGDDNFELSNEEITKFRREERVKFKKERTKEQELELKKRKNEISESELQELDEIKKTLIKFRKNNKLKIKQERQVPIEYKDMRPEDQEIIDEESMTLQEIEYLQLSAVETFYLKLIDVIDVFEADQLTLEDVFYKCCGTKTPKPDNQFILSYIAYHHYRSLGWCVRNGIKFGCDYILYKKGPPFSHAEHGILIITEANPKSWTEMQTVSRVIGSVRKNLVLNFIDVPTPNELNEILNDSDDQKFFRLLQLYKVNEILYKRWIPNRTRD
ncbi:tRNA-splicing endonuclease subunit Sen2p [[Candida] jaroonii]|uniref:tRNA-splicing endonuclease subunit Sen2p n=1 Tax=[Candida] jaroonii TaxID=467808 RepID=A0ACA9YCX4_9ASCO|nr:tRNA-splicing endonuclease subunit Sen2p [[Candida] jaroonii]